MRARESLEHGYPQRKGNSFQAQSDNKERFVTRSAITVEASYYKLDHGRLVLKKTCFSAWASTLNMGLINKG